MSFPYILSIDAGSSSCKIGIFDTRGTCIDILRISTSVSASEQGSAIREYNPEVWWDAVVKGIRSILERADVRSSQIKAVGLTGQIGTHILLGRDGNALLPAISWQDGRAAAEAAWLAENYPHDVLDNLIGMHLPPGTAWPIPRLLWLKKHQPRLFDSGFKMMQSKDYIVYRLTGNIHTDVLSLRGILNPVSKKIHPEVSRGILQIDDLQERLPDFSEAHEEAGFVTAQAAALTGLAAGTPVITGCGDFHASLVGTGIVDDSYSFNITGTSDHAGVLCPAGDTGAYDVRLGKYPAVVKGWDIWYGATSAGGGSVQWFLERFLDNSGGERSADVLGRLLSEAPSSNGLVYLPYINGERAPIWDANARGVFFGFGAGHTKAHFLRAVLEGVSFSLKQSLEIIQLHGRGGTPVKISGAAAANSDWNQIKADIFQVPVHTTLSKESSCLGAAIIAAVGGGYFSSFEEATAAMTGIDGCWEPDSTKKSYYEELFGVYKSLYPDLREHYIKAAQARKLV